MRRADDSLLPVIELDPPEPASTPATARTPSTVRALWAVVVVLLVASVTSAVVVGREDPPGERLAAAGAATADGDFAFALDVRSLGLPDAVITMTGDVDAESQRMRGELGIRGSGTGPIPIVQDGSTQYLQLRGPTAAAFGASGEKPWIRFELGAVSGLGARPGNPLDLFAGLGAIIGPVERVGEEEVRGEGTTHFRATIDGRKLPNAGRAGPATGFLRDIEVEAWLDGDDRLRRYRQTLTLPDPGGTGMPQLVVTSLELFDFGTPVTVELPSPDEVETARPRPGTPGGGA